jgi:hypothetical protein
MDAEFAGLIGRGGDHAALVGRRADHHGLAAQLGPIALFDRGVEGVHVHVQNGVHGGGEDSARRAERSWRKE